MACCGGAQPRIATRTAGTQRDEQGLNTASSQGIPTPLNYGSIFRPVILALLRPLLSCQRVVTTMTERMVMTPSTSSHLRPSTPTLAAKAPRLFPDARQAVVRCSVRRSHGSRLVAKPPTKVLNMMEALPEWFAGASWANRHVVLKRTVRHSDRG